VVRFFLAGSTKEISWWEENHKNPSLSAENPCMGKQGENQNPGNIGKKLPNFMTHFL